VVCVTAISPGTPQLPPRSQSREPGGALTRLPIRVPMAKLPDSIGPVAMRKKRVSWAPAARGPAAEATSAPPPMITARLESPVIAPALVARPDF
jgi:hypothetical protein